MEVHHHGHVHEKKKWKEYIFQFIMLLLAVFLGSFAETKREGWVEGNKEHEYIESMIEDIKQDTAELNVQYRFIFIQIQRMDSLQMLLGHDLKNNRSEVYRCYVLGECLYWYATAVFNERTYSQLIGSGNMRIIHKKGAADKIMDYYNFIKRVHQQEQQYLNYLNLTLAEMHKVLDVSYLKRIWYPEDSSLYRAFIDSNNVSLRTTNPETLLDLRGTLDNTKFVIENYMQLLKMIRGNANSLLYFLRDKYGIKEL